MRITLTSVFMGLALVGCSQKSSSGPSRPELEAASNYGSVEATDPFAGLQSYPIDHRPYPYSGILPESSPMRSSNRISIESPPAVPPLFVEGMFVPSGRMGDAEDPSGPLKYEVCTTAAKTSPTCDKWSYSPPSGSGELTWIAVAYQGPAANNWGSSKGADFSKKGYTRLTFMARGEQGGERLLVRSGGCTQLGAAHPASYEATIGTIVLDSTWKQFEIPLDSYDMSNTCSVFSFTINRAMAPEGCSFYLDDIALRGPEND